MVYLLVRLLLFQIPSISTDGRSTTKLHGMMRLHPAILGYYNGSDAVPDKSAPKVRNGTVEIRRDTWTVTLVQCSESDMQGRHYLGSFIHTLSFCL
jgi:hypothetical protein